MKVQCDLCNELVAADFAVVGDAAIDVTCSACHGRFTVTATRGHRIAVVAPAHAAGGGEAAMTCPKCGTAQRAAAACRACGLSSHRMSDYAAAQDADIAPTLLAAWRELQDHWDDRVAHEAFVRELAATQSYVWGARRYRETMRVRPRDPTAAAQIARLARMAEATLVVSATVRHDAQRAPYRGVGAVLLVLVVVLAAGLLYVAIAKKRHGESGSRHAPILPAPASSSDGHGRSTQIR